MRFIIILALFFTKVQALTFDDYCIYNSAQQDCSREFNQALLDAANLQEPIIFTSGSKYRIDRINTQGLHLDGVSLTSSLKPDNKPIILTDGISLLDINNLSLSHIKIIGIHNEDIDVIQDNFLLLIGTRAQNERSIDITIDSIDFENAAEDLLVLWQTEQVTIKNSTFKRSGLAMRTVGEPSDLRPRGSGLLFHNVTDANIIDNQFYEIKKVAMYFENEGAFNQDVEIINNHINMLNVEKPTKRYGLKGGSGIYLSNGQGADNIKISNNTILNYAQGGMRVNGSNIKILNNKFNVKGICSQQDDSISGPLVGIAIKAHHLVDTEISSNCIQNTHTGISLESWGTIKNININHNNIHGANLDFWTSHLDGAVISDVNYQEIQLEDPNKSSGGTLYMLLWGLFTLLVFNTYNKKTQKLI